MKKICMVMMTVTFAVCGHAQTDRQQVEKQVQDPQRKANAGKADAIIAKKKDVFDSTTFDNTTRETKNSKTVKASSKKKFCGNKSKSSRKGV